MTLSTYKDGGGTETSILFCVKGKERLDDKCFFVITKNVGYRYKRKTMIKSENDFPKIKRIYNDGETIKDSIWINLSEIKPFERIDPQFHCAKFTIPNNYERLKNLLVEKKILTGFAFRSGFFGSGEKPLVKIRHLNNSLLKIDKLERIPTEYYEQCDCVHLKENDILLAMDGKKEFRAAFIDETTQDIAVNQRIAVLRIDESKISPAYVFFVLISNLGQKQLMKEKTQTATVAHLSKPIIEDVRIPYVDEATVKKIDIDFRNYISSLRKTQEMFSNLSDTF